MVHQVSVAEDISKVAIFRHSMDEIALENTLMEQEGSANGAISHVPLRRDSSPSFLPQFTFQSHEDESDWECSPRTSVDLATDFQAGLHSLMERESHDLDDTSEDDLESNGEGAALTHREDIGVSSRRTKQFAVSTNPPRAIPTSPQNEVLEMESRSRLQIPVSGDSGRISHARSRSGCSDCSTLLGTEDEDEEFPMRKDRTDDIIQVIEIPIPRKRRSTILGKLKQTLGSPPKESIW